MNDTADSRSIAVLRTRLPYTDRRSLSQAWFSALHLAEESRSAFIPARRSSDVATGAGTRGRGVARACEGAAPAPKAHRPASLERPVRASEAVAERSPRNTRVPAIAIASAFERARSYPAFTTTLTVGVDGARVKLLVRREGPTLHVVALCAERNVELVRRALACADAHLRRSGESLRASVRGLAEARV